MEGLGERRYARSGRALRLKDKDDGRGGSGPGDRSERVSPATGRANEIKETFRCQRLGPVVHAHHPSTSSNPRLLARYPAGVQHSVTPLPSFLQLLPLLYTPQAISRSINLCLLRSSVTHHIYPWSALFLIDIAGTASPLNPLDPIALHDASQECRLGASIKPLPGRPPLAPAPSSECTTYQATATSPFFSPPIPLPFSLSQG